MIGFVFLQICGCCGREVERWRWEVGSRMRKEEEELLKQEDEQEDELLKLLQSHHNEEQTDNYGQQTDEDATVGRTDISPVLFAICRLSVGYFGRSYY